MMMFFIRILLLIVIAVFLLANVVIPAFMQNVPFFWMFKLRKAEKAHKDEIEKLDNDAMDSAVRENIEERKKQ